MKTPSEMKKAVEFMTLMNMTEKLGFILGLNAVWKDGYVIYSDGEDYACTELVLDICTGRWQIVTEERGMLNLSKEAVEMMGEISKLWEAKEKEHGNSRIGYQHH